MRRKSEGQYGLSVEASVPYGNACDVEISQMRGQRVVSFAADPHGGPECMWFCFRLRAGGPSTGKRRIKLVLTHVTNMLGAGSAPALMPVIRYDGGDWDRLPVGNVERLEDGRARIGWSIEPPTTFADIAFCYPYGLPEIEALVADTHGYWRVDTIGISQEGRPLIRLSNGAGKPGDDRRGLFLITRQHSGETPGSRVLDGLLRAIAEAGEGAPLVWAVPLADMDGIIRGDYGKDRFPYDLNRAWGAKPMRHETLVYQCDMQRWKERCRPLLAVDLHAPGAGETDGVFCYVPDPELKPDQHKSAVLWADRFCSALGPTYAAQDFKKVANYKSRWETPGFTTYCREILGVSAITFEIPYAAVGELVLTREGYKEIGQLLADAIMKGGRKRV